MTHKPFFLTVALVSLLALAGVFYWMSQKRQVAVDQPVVTDPLQEGQQKETDEIESIRDLIDGEYIFTSIDTSDWQTYRNEEAGFEVKIPKDWFCGGVALDPNSKRSFACLEEKERKAYYAGKFGKDDVVMINFPDLEKISVDPLRENLMSAKKNGSKIHNLMIDKKNSILVVESTLVVSVYDDSSEWYLVASPSVEKKIFDGFLQSFRFLK